MNRQLLAIQGCAIIEVVLSHSISLLKDIIPELNLTPPAPWENLVLITIKELGIFVVPTFLFISGCFYAYAAQSDNPKTPRRSALVGLRRLLPPYLIWSIVFYLVIYLTQGTSFTPLGYLKNLAVGYPYNFIPLLAFFYLISPILTRLFKRYGKIILAGILVYQFILINITHPGILGFTLPSWMNFLAPPILKNTLADWAIFFPLGIYYSYRSKKMTDFLIRYRWLFIFATALTFGIAVLYFADILPFEIIRFVAPLFFISIIPTVKRSEIPFVRPLEQIGKKSYGLYLLNLMVIYVLLLLVKMIIPGMFNFRLGIFVMVAGLAFVVQFAMMVSLEKSRIRIVYPYIFG